MTFYSKHHADKELAKEKRMGPTNKTTHWVEVGEIDFTEMLSGTVLKKVTAIDKGTIGQDMTVEIHGLIDEQGKLFVTDVITRPPEEGSE